MLFSSFNLVSVDLIFGFKSNQKSNQQKRIQNEGHSLPVQAVNRWLFTALRSNSSCPEYPGLESRI